MAKIEIDGIEMTREAAGFAEETGSKPQADVAALLARGVHDGWFLDVCTDGASPDRIDGAHEYYHAISAEAHHRREIEEDASLPDEDEDEAEGAESA